MDVKQRKHLIGYGYTVTQFGLSSQKVPSYKSWLATSDWLDIVLFYFNIGIYEK
jgi:hypothetical protein